jgi:hypothetical protein
MPSHPHAIALAAALAALLCGCGSSIRGELPPVGRSEAGLLTVEEARERVAALERARDERVAQGSTRPSR